MRNRVERERYRVERERDEVLMRWIGVGTEQRNEGVSCKRHDDDDDDDMGVNNYYYYYYKSTTNKCIYN